MQRRSSWTSPSISRPRSRIIWPSRKPAGCRASPTRRAVAASRTASSLMPISPIRRSTASWRRMQPSPTPAASARSSIATRPGRQFRRPRLHARRAVAARFRPAAAHGLSFDMQLYAPQMADGAATARRHPDTQIIINHTGMPLDRDPEGLAAWRSGMRALAACPNVAVKISGLGMVDHHWTVESIRPSCSRRSTCSAPRAACSPAIFRSTGSFPTMPTVWRAFDQITGNFSVEERNGLFHDNAERIYRL